MVVNLPGSGLRHRRRRRLHRRSGDRRRHEDRAVGDGERKGVQGVDARRQADRTATSRQRQDDPAPGVSRPRVGPVQYDGPRGEGETGSRERRALDDAVGADGLWVARMTRLETWPTVGGLGARVALGSAVERHEREVHVLIVLGPSSRICGVVIDRSGAARPGRGSAHLGFPAASMCHPVPPENLAAHGIADQPLDQDQLPRRSRRADDDPHSDPAPGLRTTVVGGVLPSGARPTLLNRLSPSWRCRSRRAPWTAGPGCAGWRCRCSGTGHTAATARAVVRRRHPDSVAHESGANDGGDWTASRRAASP